MRTAALLLALVLGCEDREAADTGSLEADADADVDADVEPQACEGWVDSVLLDHACGYAPLQVFFNGHTAVEGMAFDGVEQVMWDFGDGEVAYDQASTVHIYQEPGEYEAVLTIDGWYEEGSVGVSLAENFVRAL
ncbi:MAG: PKD domain-containing protein [Deltaproteobacteria bacterium]|nr:PKD domain-containing protein [Deltaproteobacteria bacterium]